MQASIADDYDERRDVEQLCYLGLRTAFGATPEFSRESLRAVAHDCTERKFKQLNLWETQAANDSFSIRFENEENLKTALSAGRGAIVCTPHVGSYHFIPLELVKRRYAVTMLLDTANFERERQKFEWWERRFAGQQPLRYINAELPNAAWEMARDLRQERIIFVWLDGNAGIAKHDEAKTLVEIEFCSLRVLVRKGLAFLAAWNNSPIVYALALPQEFPSTAIQFAPPIKKADSVSKDDFCQQAMQAVWSRLETSVREDLACWEEWYHLHLWQLRESATGDIQAGFDTDTVLNLILERDTPNNELLELSQGVVLTNLRTGAALLRTAQVRIVLDACDGERTMGQILTALAAQFDEITILETLHALSAGGFVKIRAA